MASIDSCTSSGCPRCGCGSESTPVFALDDPVRHEPSFFGEHVIRAARIEPVTPPGAVFVTASFAALVALEERTAFACEYVGQIPAAKNFGVMPMHVLRRRTLRA